MSSAVPTQESQTNANNPPNHQQVSIVEIQSEMNKEGERARTVVREIQLLQHSIDQACRKTVDVGGIQAEIKKLEAELGQILQRLISIIDNAFENIGVTENADPATTSTQQYSTAHLLRTNLLEAIAGLGLTQMNNE